MKVKELVEKAILIDEIKIYKGKFLFAGHPIKIPDEYLESEVAQFFATNFGDVLIINIV